jgi:D123
MTPEYFALVLPTYIENWPGRLHALSIRQVDIPLSLAQARALGSNIRHFGRWFGPSLPIDDVASRLEVALQEFPLGAFVRLGSRSGKDCEFARASGMRVASRRGALLMLTDGSERIAWDLRLALRFDYPPHIFVREWRAIPAWAEFRCFMKKRRLIGVSQYDCVNLAPRVEIAEHANALFSAIQVFFNEFRDAVHLDDVVFDVFVEPEKAAGSRALSIRLLELNPFLPKTDACLFRWDWGRADNGDFDASFRYLRP